MHRSFSMLVLLLAAAFHTQVQAQKLPDKFPPQYTGDSLTEIQAIIGADGRNLIKDEFETTAEAIQRVDKLLKESRVNGHSLEHILLVFSPTCNYDAEVKTYTCRAFDHGSKPLIFVNGSELPAGALWIPNFGQDGLQWTWQMDSSLARKAKPYLRVAVVGRPAFSMYGLTLDDVSDTAVFNYTTGEIYKNMKPKP